MVEFIFDLQRFDGSSSGGSSSGASGGGTGSSSSGGSNAKTDSDTATEEVVVWVDDWAGYETKLRSALAAEAYSTAQIFPATTYVATALADNIPVLGHENNIIYGLDRFDTVSFVDLNLESFATFYNYTKYNNYVDLVFDAKTLTGSDSGTVTRLYLSGLNIDNPNLVAGNFTPVLSFASGLNVVYNFDLKEWFGSDELAVAANFWSNYYAQAGSISVDEKGNQTGTLVPSEVFLASRDINNFITGVDWQDGIYFYDTSPAELTFTQKTGKALAMTFLNGTGALVQYDGYFSPTFYFSDGTAYVYNSKKEAWRTVADAWADAVEYAAEDAQSALDKALVDVNYNVIYNANDWDEYTAFPVSRWANTEIYGTTLTNDIYFNDAVSSNVVNVIHEDDSHFDIIFDTGAVTRIEYADIVSPVLHFMDGNLVFDLGVKNQTSLLETDYTTGFVSASSGTRRPRATGSLGGEGTSSGSSGGGSSSGSISGGTSSADLAVDGLAVSYDPADDNMSNGGQQNDNNKTDEGGAVVNNTTTNIKSTSGRTADSTDTSFEYIREAFTVSRYSDKFINKVTAQDDIYLVDTAFANISDFNITSNFDIILKFDTGKQLRVRDNSIISPVFHFADGTDTAYNWGAAQWVAATDVTAYNNGIADVFTASAFTNSFFRNVEAVDYIYIPDATYANIADIDANDYYVNITLDTGENIAVRNTTEGQSPTFLFADGREYRYYSGLAVAGNAYYGTDLDVAEVFNVSKGANNVVYYTGEEDFINFVDAVSSDVISMENPDAYTIEFTFANGTTTTVDYWESLSPLFTFADGVMLRYNYGAGTWVTPATGEAKTFTGTSAVDMFNLSKDDNNTVSEVRDNDIITFTDATSANVIDTEVTSNAVTFTFDNGATTTINYTSYYTPTIQFSDGVGYQYYYSSYSGEGRRYNAYYGTNGADVFSISGDVANRVNNAGAADTIFIDKNYSDVTYQYLSTSNYTPYIDLDFGSNYTYIYYNSNEGLTPNIVFADGTTLQYNTYTPDYSAVDNIMISRFNNSIVYYAHDDDYISVVDATPANVTSFGTDYNATLTFDTGKTAVVGQYDTVSPLFLFADGSTLAYANSTKAWATPIDASTFAENVIPLSDTVTNIVYNADASDTIYIGDASQANITDIDATASGSLSITFDTGVGTTIVYTGNVTPLIALADNNTIQYNIYNPTYQADTFDLSRNANNVLRSYVRPDDTVNFTDATLSNVSEVRFDSIGWDVEFTFDTGKSTYVEFAKSDGATPTFTFSDGSAYRYVTSYSSEAVKDVWQRYDASTGTWTTASESVLPIYTSADLAESADLWGDTVADDLFVDGTIATDATLSDMVAAPVDNAAVSFNAETVFDFNTSGALVASSAYLTTRKTA